MKTLYKYLALALLGTTIYACKKELGALPKNAKVDANTILDQATAQIALNGAYYAFANATMAQTNWQDHQVVPGMLSGYLSYGYSSFAEEKNDNTEFSSHYWDESYILLNAANGVIKGVNALPDQKFVGNRKKEVIAEAHFLRAYAHFKLLCYYGEWYHPESNFGILLRDELSTLGNITKARSTVKESYDFILADLDDVIANGPVSNPSYYATRWAGMALKARVLISRRGGAADYAEIISLAEQIKNGGFVLEPNVQDIFRSKGLGSKEVILGIKPQSGQEMNAYSKTRQYWPGASFLFTATAALNTLLKDDPRQAWIIGGYNPKGLSESYFFTKYIAVGGTPTVTSETDYALRLTEVYLLKAEAIVRSGGDLADAKALIHEVQAKAGITATINNVPYLAVENATTSAALLKEIFNEDVKSLVGEDGLEWLALLRIFSLDEVKKMKPTILTEAQYILPVPKTEFTYNPAFGLQNPGYSAF
ncbi:RagB/SusD family nutrient uptake outer membrane protein [Pedobacter hiemivivus]|uniref:RagB/SusD family nutrient uptake outer membrane protein n=1 Tax=Pedobacter hiemivivus TaxID=2530454 RepID=A0A4U1FVY0_9SPHI|nr:RagB/SusD family nutrient uptake outer membrane protein [Pedobacter hiemivivus]TKC54981.1 RagB/SusD family nutrient uptake outer membrane protein [Pedobacter hiemivivus]